MSHMFHTYASFWVGDSSSHAWRFFLNEKSIDDFLNGKGFVLDSLDTRT